MTSTKKTGAIVAGLLVAGLAALGTAAALDIIDGPDQILSVFESDTRTSAFTLTDADTDLRGRDALEVTYTVENTDNQTHDAEITVQLLDGNGTPIQKNGTVMEHAETATVDAGATHTGTGSFAKDGVVSEYESAFVTVDQVTSG